jgi:toxin-antitoxin system PIN domain toxin
MIALLDVNVLISLMDEDHPAHTASRVWFEQNHADGWATCPITENGCVRIMSAVGYANPLPTQDVATRLAEATAAPEHVFWADDVSILDASIVDTRHVQGAKQLTDIYLLALAVKHGGRLVTRDGKIPMHAVRGAGPKHLLVL